MSEGQFSRSTTEGGPMIGIRGARPIAAIEYARQHKTAQLEMEEIDMEVKAHS